MEMKYNLSEVSFIRPLLIILVVLYHAFAPFAGTWREFAGFVPNEAYRYIANISYSSMLETFVFISGYVFSYQCLYLNKNYSLKQLCIKKGKRLLLPYLIFGFIYLLLFGDIGNKGFYYVVSELLGGVGHLWFLMMLFWCFIALWFLTKLRLNDISLLLISLLLAICSPIGKFFQIGSAMYYLLYFFLGWLFFKHHKAVHQFVTRNTVIVLAILYLFAFLFFSKGAGILKSNSIQHTELSLFSNACIMGSMRMLRISYSFLGVLFYYYISIKITTKYSLNKHIISYGKLCLGVYIFQQFVLQFLYYRTNLPIVVGPYVLPWVGFGIALLVSTFMTYLVRLSLIGKRLL